MLSKNTAKRITSLAQKKYRQREKLFVAEGVKVISELLDSNFELAALYVEENSAFAKAVSTQSIPGLLPGVEKPNQIPTTVEVTMRELSKISFLKTSQTALATFKIPPATKVNREGLTLVLNDIRDPGNLGTIIRLCDWFGIRQLICSKETVDCYNPKVVQATMGSLTRVQIIYTDLQEYLVKDSRPIFGTFMDGENIYKAALPSEGIVIVGNEANGISGAIAQLVTKRVAIPRFGKEQVTESLNVAMATSICLSEFRRSNNGV